MADGVPLPIFPMGVPALVCLAEEKSSRTGTTVSLYIVGKILNMEELSSCRHISLIAYFFKPFIANALFGIAAKKLTDSRIPLPEWNHKKAASLQEKIKNAKTTAERITAIDEFVLSQIRIIKKPCDIVRISTDRILRDHSKDILSAIQGELGVTERTLQRVFKKYVGVTPNQFRRVCQFQGSFQQLRKKQFSKLADVAFEQEYADQSHFTRSFREFTGRSPHEYIKHGMTKRTT